METAKEAQRYAAELVATKRREAKRHQQGKTKWKAATAGSAPRVPIIAEQRRCLPQVKRMARDRANDARNIARRIESSTNEKTITGHRHKLLSATEEAERAATIV